VRVITADEIRRSVEPLDLVDAMREAFVSISRSRVRTTFSLLDLDAGDVHVKAAHHVGGDVYVVKVASAVPTNRERGLPVGNGGILISSAIIGQPLAFLVDEHYLTDARTAAAGALATDLLAAPDAATLTVLGAGVQARLQASTLARLRPLQRVTVWARRSAAAERLADELRATLGTVTVETAATVREAVLSSEIVVAATASTEPLIQGDWLRPGQHLTALGADDDRKRELDSDCFARADRVVVDSRAQTCATAELGVALRDGAIGLDSVVELGEIISGEMRSRTRPEEVTVAKLTGVAAQDLAAARVVLDRLDKRR
jgi:ornithine cyclodeaminase/alanine dehydrogenase-like protein (mu-crystallin family)